MMCSIASSTVRLRGRPPRLARSTPTPSWAKGAVLPAAVSAKPSRSSEANHVAARWAGAPTSTNRLAIGDMSERVSLTSKRMTAGTRGPSMLTGRSELGSVVSMVLLGRFRWWRPGVGCRRSGSVCRCTLRLVECSGAYLDVSSSQAPYLDVGAVSLECGPRVRGDVGATQHARETGQWRHGGCGACGRPQVDDRDPPSGSGRGRCRTPGLRPVGHDRECVGEQDSRGPFWAMLRTKMPVK